MKIRHDLMRELDRPLVLAIGFFDGLHVGHREIVRATLRLRKPGRRAGVFTFANHPASFLRPGTQPPLLATPQERLDRLAEAGFEECFFLPFDEEIATMSPREFLDVLLARLGVCSIAVGETFRFGHKRTGDVSLMRTFLASRNVDVVVVPSVAVDGERVSSTRIRALVAGGDLARADELLGYSYELRGTVEIGAGRGHGLGFPTANIRPPEKLLPKEGVYAAVARYDGRDYAALVSIGTNPQFGENGERTVEVWMRDFRGTIYGRELCVRDLRYVRAQHAFASIDDLVAQMRRDLEAVAYPSFA
ncbi:MAG TPA: riboflavin biosynthesis protein RibF [Candidatus Tyrphobacter sp.]